MPLKSTARFFALAPIFLVPFFALIVTNDLFFPFITGKAFYFRLLVEIAFAAWVILAALDAKYRPRWNSITIGVTVFAVITLVADLLGVNPIRSLWSNFERMEGWIVVAHLWMFYMAAVHSFGIGEEGKKMWKYWMNTSLAAAVIVAGDGLLQLSGVFPIHQSGTRIDASLGNAEYMAVYMLLNAGFAMYLFLKSRKGSHSEQEEGSLLRLIYGFYSFTVVFSWLGFLSAGVRDHHVFVWSWVPLILAVPAVLLPIYIRSIRLSFLEGLYSFLAVTFSFLLFETATRGTVLGLIGAFIVICVSYAVFAKGVTWKKLAVVSSFPVLELIAFFVLHSYKLSILVIPALYFIGLIIFVIMDKKDLAPRVQISRWVGIGIVGLVMLGVFSFYLLKDTSFVKNNDTLSRLASISISDFSTSGRAYIWPMAIKGSIERPILGWGQENFNYIFNANYNPKMYNQEQWFDRAHSVYLDWLVGSGFVGLAAYLALYVLLLIVLWKSQMSVAEKSVLTGLLAGYAIHNIFVFDNLASYVLFFALLGFVASSKALDVKSAPKPPMDISKDIVEYAIAPVAIIALLFGIYWLNVRPLQENARLITALQACGSNPDAALFTSALAPGSYVGLQEAREQILQCAAQVINAQQIPGPTKQAFFQLASDAVTDQIKATPNDARIYTLGGSFYAQIGAYNQALPLLEKAHSISEGKQSISVILATVYVNLGKADKAEALLKTAYAAETADDEVRTALISVMIIDGHEADAKKQFSDHPELFQTEQAAQAYTLAKEYDKAISVYESIIGTSTDMVSTQFHLAQTEYAAGYVYQGIQTLRDIETVHPEYKTQLEAYIKQMQAGK
jgi:tetratricopeptide (TPR) repeat protein